MSEIFYHKGLGRVVEREGRATRIHWSADMLDYLRRHFATTLNDELAGELGVSPRTMIRKARELNLEKSHLWLTGVWEERRKWANIAAKRLGYPGGFKKGEHRNPAGEFKPGHAEPLESRQRRGEKMREWYRLNPDKAHAKSLKAWETRRSLDTHSLHRRETTSP